MKLERFGGDDARVEAIWRRLEAQTRPTYFLSWAWIENWLACLPKDQRPELALISDGEPVAACFLGRRRMVRHRVVASDSLFLNATGVPHLDELCIEHNGLLGARVRIEDLIELLRDVAWDELVGTAVDRASLPAAGTGYRVVVDREVSCPYVDLDQVRAKGYLEILGGSTRSQIRRARRGLGEIRVEIAETESHAFAIYDELVKLHTRSWQARGQAGSFADAWFDGFHRRLIRERLRHGEIQLVRVSAEDTIGCLYNFVSHGRVLFYQSGLARFDDARIKPGFVCHAAAIELAARAGHATYDLLGGDARYKQALATAETKLVWMRVQRARLRFALEDRARALARLVRTTASRSAAR